MNMYEQLISEATGIEDIERVRMVEQYMRHIYFHSTLDWQTEQQLKNAAIMSAEEVAANGWRFQ